MSSLIYISSTTGRTTAAGRHAQRAITRTASPKLSFRKFAEYFALSAILGTIERTARIPPDSGRRLFSLKNRKTGAKKMHIRRILTAFSQPFFREKSPVTYLFRNSYKNEKRKMLKFFRSGNNSVILYSGKIPLLTSGHQNL
jgi:hypothetical protein